MSYMASGWMFKTLSQSGLQTTALFFRFDNVF